MRWGASSAGGPSPGCLLDAGVSRLSVERPVTINTLVKQMFKASERKIWRCVGGRIWPEGLLIAFRFYAGVSKLNDERLAARKMPCEGHIWKLPRDKFGFVLGHPVILAQHRTRGIPFTTKNSNNKNICENKKLNNNKPIQKQKQEGGQP